MKDKNITLFIKLIQGQINNEVAINNNSTKKTKTNLVNFIAYINSIIDQSRN